MSRSFVDKFVRKSFAASDPRRVDFGPVLRRFPDLQKYYIPFIDLQNRGRPGPACTCRRSIAIVRVHK